MNVYDVAKICGVAPSTISKVINNYKGVSNKTREDVLNKLKELNFQPNAVARSLAKNRSDTVGVIISTSNDIGLMHFFFIELLDCFKKELEKNSVDLIFIPKDTPKIESYLTHCKLKMIDGVIVFGDVTEKNVKELIDSEIPTVVFDHFGDKVSGATSDNFGSMKILTDHIIALGHKNIVFVSGEKTFSTDSRINGFKASLKDNGIDFQDYMHMYSNYYDERAAVEATRKILSLNKGVSAILYSDDYNAIYAIKELRRQGLNVPDDISVAGFDGITMAHLLEPELTTVAQDIKGIGAYLANRLLEIISDGSKSKGDLKVFDSKLVFGGSAKKI